MKCPWFVFLLPLAIGFAAIPTTPASTGFVPSPPSSVTAATPMSVPRSGHTATLLPDGRVLIAGGMRRNHDFYRSAELFDPATDKFQPTGEMSIGRVGHAAVLLSSGKVLIVGGWIGQGCTGSVELYDPRTGKFATIGKMTARRGQPSATLLFNGEVLIAGGADHDSPGGIASAEIFDPTTMRFESVAPMHYARTSHTSTLLKDGRVLIAGGRGDGVTATAELYDPKSRHFNLTGSMLMARYKHTAGLLSDGRILIAGGSDERDWRGTVSSAELYDPSTGKFTATSPMHDRRFKLPNQAVRLASGQLLIAGGSKEVELYDPESGSFIVAAGRISDDWHFMTETELKDGRVLLAGGYPDDDKATQQTWIFHP